MDFERLHSARAGGDRHARRRKAAALLSAVALGGAAAGHAQVSPLGGQFQVNTYTTLNQSVPAVAADSAGNFVVAWRSLGSSGTDTNGYSVQAQLYAANGDALGGQFQVNAYITGNQHAPSVAANSAGDFVVVWQSEGSSGTDTSGDSIQAQRYAANGAAQGAPFQVNTYTTNHQSRPSVASDSLGNFVVVWHSLGSSGTDTSGNSIQAQRYDADGVALGGQFQVNAYSTSDQDNPSVAADSAGNFVVVWQSDGSSGTDTFGKSVQAQRYAANGAAQGGQFQVNSYTTGGQYYPAVARSGPGSFVVAWLSENSSGTDTNLGSIQAQRFDAGGAAQGGQFQVNSYTTGSQGLATVAVDSAGSFVITWFSDGSSGTDISLGSIQAQRYAANGAALGGESQVNAYTTGDQSDPVVTLDSQGHFVIVWRSSGSYGTDTMGMSIQARRFGCQFCDGFESGDTDLWPVVAP